MGLGPLAFDCLELLVDVAQCVHVLLVEVAHGFHVLVVHFPDCIPDCVHVLLLGVLYEVLHLFRVFLEDLVEGGPAENLLYLGFRFGLLLILALRSGELHLGVWTGV